MKLLKTLVLAAPMLGLLSEARDASACGGCFVPPEVNTQVTSHRMILAVGNEQTTLWDQIQYTGAPESFAWVLPIRGIVTIGLSSDLLFETLDQNSTVTIFPPPLNCPSPGCLNADGSFGNAGASGTGGASAGGVEVLAHEVVGPYETVQLDPDNPAALNTWLTEHNYSLPDDVKPVVDQYVGEGFNFLALKLVPGQGISAMKPVRVTTPGASPVLPLRMVAAGTGAITPITLFVVGEGRYEPSNFPSFTIQEKDLVWDWAAGQSNYKTLRQAGFDAQNGRSWIVEMAQPQSRYLFENLISTAQYSPEYSGYGGPGGDGAVEEAQEDVDTLLGAMHPESLWVTRLFAELPRAALGTDLRVGASGTQTEVSPYFNVTNTVGDPPPCPQVQSCGGEYDSGYGIGVSLGDESSATPTGSKSEGCAVGSKGEAPRDGLALGLLLAASALYRIRRRDGKAS